MGLKAALQLLQQTGRVASKYIGDVGLGIRKCAKPDPVGIRFAPEVVGDTLSITNKIKWTPKWLQKGFQIPQASKMVDLTDDGLKASQMLRNESRIASSTPIPHSFLDGDLGVKILDNKTLIGRSQCEIMQVDFLQDKTLLNVIDDFSSVLSKRAFKTEEEKIKFLMSYVDDIFSVTRNDEKLLRLTEEFPMGQVVKLGDIIDSGAGVCRHRALLLKILGDKNNMDISLVKGCYKDGHHAWNEFITKNGKKYLVDPMHRNIVDLSNNNIKDLRALSYSQGHSTELLYASEYSGANNLFGHIYNMKKGEALSLGGRVTLYKPNDTFALYPQANQNVLLNGKPLETATVLKNKDLIEYVDIKGQPTKIVWEW